MICWQPHLISIVYAICNRSFQVYSGSIPQYQNWLQGWCNKYNISRLLCTFKGWFLQKKNSHVKSMIFNSSSICKRNYFKTTKCTGVIQKMYLIFNTTWCIFTSAKCYKLLRKCQPQSSLWCSSGPFPHPFHPSTHIYKYCFLSSLWICDMQDSN